MHSSTPTDPRECLKKVWQVRRYGNFRKSLYFSKLFNSPYFDNRYGNVV